MHIDFPCEGGETGRGECSWAAMLLFYMFVYDGINCIVMINHLIHPDSE